MMFNSIVLSTFIGKGAYMATKLEVKVCVGSSCHVKGGSITLKALEALIDKKDLSDKIDLRADLCLGNCLDAPNVVVDGEVYGGITPEKVENFFLDQIMPRLPL